MSDPDVRALGRRLLRELGEPAACITDAADFGDWSRWD
jgi:hypothetical protein